MRGDRHRVFRFLAAAAALLIAPAAVSARIPADSAQTGCPTTGSTVRAESGARLFLVGSDLYGCASDSDPRLLDTVAVPEALAMPRISGQFAAYSLDKRVRVADISDGRSTTFESAALALRVNKFGRVGWIAQRDDGVLEVHRADLAGREMVLDHGARIRPGALTVRRGKLRWRNGSRLHGADFDGQRGDRAPLAEPRLGVVSSESAVHGPGPKAWRFAVEVEDGLPTDDAAFARAIEKI